MLLRSLLSNGDLLLQSTGSRFLCKRCIQNIRIGIIGSGPAGFYTAQALLKDERVNIDIYEKYPVPFGLIRFGVAPDHQSVKNVIKSFTNTALNKRVTFYGNVGVGTDLSLKELRKAYHGIVLCYGASEDRKLNIEGEDLVNVIPARRFVGWYNGIPQDADLKVNLNAESVVIVGHGNVALDCARILLSPVEEALKSTDITEHSLNALRESKVKTVYIVGRRGPLQVSFTIKELRELTKIPGVDTIVSRSDFESLSPQIIENLPRPKKRLTEFLVNLAKEPNFHNNFKKCVILFQRSPLKILGNKRGEVDSVILGVNELREEDGHIRAYPSGKTEEVRCGLFLRSIGFRAVSIDESIPMDDKTGVIKNSNGKIEGVGEGLYCSGWAATGATGVILGTMNASFEIAGHILKDLEANVENLGEKPGSSRIIKSLQEKGIEVVTFQDWQRIDELERDIGLKKGKPREKLINQDDMVKVVKDKSL